MRNLEIYNYIMLLTARSGLSRHDAAAFYAAFEAALDSTFPDFQIGCAIVASNKLLTVGANTSKSDPFQKRYNMLYREFTDASYCCREHSLHAETAALKSVRYPIARKTDWRRTKAYVYRISPGLPWKQGLAAPCQACCHALADYGVRKLYFSDESGFVEGRISEDGILVV